MARPWLKIGAVLYNPDHIRWIDLGASVPATSGSSHRSGVPRSASASGVVVALDAESPEGTRPGDAYLRFEDGSPAANAVREYVNGLD